jgi:peroxiredoxin
LKVYLSSAIKYLCRRDAVMKVRVGDKAPNFTLQSHLDKEVTLSDYRGKTTVLVFFPQAFTPV